MSDKESNINDEEKPYAETNKQQFNMYKQLNSVLAYGSNNLGLNNYDWKNDSEERIKEDLKK